MTKKAKKISISLVIVLLAAVGWLLLTKIGGLSSPENVKEEFKQFYKKVRDEAKAGDTDFIRGTISDNTMNLFKQEISFNSEEEKIKEIMATHSQIEDSMIKSYFCKENFCSVFYDPSGNDAFYETRTYFNDSGDWHEFYDVKSDEEKDLIDQVNGYYLMQRMIEGDVIMIMKIDNKLQSVDFYRSNASNSKSYQISLTPGEHNVDIELVSSKPKPSEVTYKISLDKRAWGDSQQKDAVFEVDTTEVIDSKQISFSVKAE